MKMAGLAGNGLKLMEITLKAGNGHKLLEIAFMAGSGWKGWNRL